VVARTTAMSPPAALPSISPREASTNAETGLLLTIAYSPAGRVSGSTKALLRNVSGKSRV
jgi:hypothetical protein